MRVDKLLSKLCLIKTRSIAKNACDKKLVKINGKIAKASAMIINDDIIDFELYGYFNKIKITEVPKGNVSKVKAPEYYEILTRDKLDL
ncbi:MAG: S4 domain-containing protein [Candidatus Tenebribacter burtonii]|jgi:ribosome-associated heat shock protein Hsp15|nr:S4 domain-containing protein [Candidatus Tenebribacter burtonii]